MDEIKISLAGVQQIAADLRNSAQRSMDEVSQLGNRADPSAVWTDQAATSYRNAFLTWQKAQQNAQTALTQLGKAVDAVAQNYQEVSQRGAQTFDSFFQ